MPKRRKGGEYKKISKKLMDLQELIQNASSLSGSSEAVNMRFSIEPTPGESGFSQWVSAMKMVAQLPGGIPPEFRRRLWLTMAEKHLLSRGVNWSEVEKNCFSEWSHPADAELGIQIVKDLHRTGCSLFCGEDGRENQALLKKVLLAYARWNKSVGYCQGFNMLAALILQVTDKCGSDALKLMIYLIEGVLPDSYFANSLRGLSIDMAVFRELLRSKLPRLSKHLDLLQNAVKDGSRSYEPPLTNVFTMQWFLTLFCNCLPQSTVLRVWDLIFLEGNEILLRTALAIWQVLAPRILGVRTADEFYCTMGLLTRELLEFDLIDANSIIKAIVSVGALKELKSLREHYLYNITPWGTSIPRSEIKQINLHPKQTIPLDIGALKKQYLKLKQRQRQAHVIFSAAISGQPPQATPVAMNHLLLGKSALVPSKRIGPLKGSIPPPRQVPSSTLQWKDTQKPSSSSSSSDTELCDDEVHSLSDEEDDAQFGNNVKSVEKGTSGIAAEDEFLVNFDTSSAIDGANVPPPADKKSIALATSPINIKLTSDSEEDSSDFEMFLADRVKGFKKTDNAKAKLTRRNSERALQIIQENSLILHRIMQCQSRLSPSPPLIFDDISENQHDSRINSLSPSSIDDISEKSNEMDKSLWWLDNDETRTEAQSVEREERIVTTPSDFGLRYRNILEKSKSLDDRYNSLILNYNKEVLPNMTGLHESKSETPVYAKTEDLPRPLSPCTSSHEDYITASVPDVGSTESRSRKLIQENLNLLKSFALNKPKNNEDEFSESTASDNLTSSISDAKYARKSYTGDSSESAEFNKHDLSITPLMKIENYDSFSTVEYNNSFTKILDNCISENNDIMSKKDSSTSEAVKESLNVNLIRFLDDDLTVDVRNQCSTENNPLSPTNLTLTTDNKNCDNSIELIKAKSLPSLNVTTDGLDKDSSSASIPERSDGSGVLKKSSTQIFNPFPVSLSSRRSKKLPLMLGIYKT